MITNETRQRIKDLRASGMLIREITAELGVSSSVIRRALANMPYINNHTQEAIAKRNETQRARYAERDIVLKAKILKLQSQGYDFNGIAIAVNYTYSGLCHAHNRLFGHKRDPNAGRNRVNLRDRVVSITGICKVCSAEILVEYRDLQACVIDEQLWWSKQYMTCPVCNTCFQAGILVSLNEFVKCWRDSTVSDSDSSIDESESL